MIIEDWGLMPYLEAQLRQEELVRQRLAGLCGDRLVSVEHDPVYTLGATLSPQEGSLLRAGTWEGVPVVQTRRGGGITYHGPGQCVLYPIVSLEASLDLHAYLRRLEGAVIATLKALGISAHPRPGLTGVWVGDAKIAAIGIAVRRFVTYHGVALNNTNDLTPFSRILPCRIPQHEGSVTRIADFLKSPPTRQALAALFLQNYKADSV